MSNARLAWLTERQTSTGSNREQRNRVYQFIGEVALPGDLIFVVSAEAPPVKLWDRLKWWVNYRSQGYPAGDWSEWGTMVFSHMQKESKGAAMVPVVYQSKEPQLKQFALPPGYFRGGSRLEILRFKGLQDAQRQTICNYLNERNLRAHDHSELRWNRITFLTGLPNIFIQRNLENCVRTTMEAFEKAGVLFRHRCDLMPVWNYARYRGRPWLHSEMGVSPYYNYLQDHHIYSDPQVELMATVHQEDGAYIMERTRQKYSWLAK